MHSHNALGVKTHAHEPSEDGRAAGMAAQAAGWASVDPQDDRAACNSMGKSGQRAGVHPHRFRHTCATNLLEGGADTRMVQAMLDHEDLSTTALYTKVTDAR